MVGDNTFDALRAFSLSVDANEATRMQFPFTIDARNNEADAFRHALWSYLMVQKIGPENGNRIARAHEISAVNPPGERLMDLYNNRVGVMEALDPLNRGRPAVEVILDALKAKNYKLNRSMS